MTRREGGLCLKCITRYEYLSSSNYGLIKSLSCCEGGDRLAFETREGRPYIA